MNPAAMAGMVGVGISAGAYVPQIGHMFRAHCAGGISRAAFAAWLISSLLCMWQAIAIGALTFVLLGTIQTVATIMIMCCAVAYHDSPCPIHAEGNRVHL